MSTLYRVDSSIQGDVSVTREITDEFERAWSATAPEGVVNRRDLVTTPLAPAVWTAALAAHGAGERTKEQQSAADLAADLAGEMLAADAIVIGAPLYNWGPSQHVKCWIDMLWTDPRFGPRTYPLTGKPVVLVVSRGGGASVGAPQEGWDHSVPYLLRTFGTDVFGADVTLIETELTLAGRSPAMAHLQDKAVELRARSHELARETGEALAKLAA
ncbi:FMN-dependent NADH-azoreductase [Amycolatopsis jiangsuensis]|uniref:FMN-dependent NADH-azoreductase n=1 Tax=Amycolatopsis jiangsuensis TaxID=1181879 RepID=A0A840J0D1_9PSEU|nr:NAD(P)H-dependent oxidoreductase [Amycolatopsis jiangsuensis]MBB4687189.1 FMN-dependent NADH-azoreductase [Amycolatopsis jiangsuensis]